MTKLAPLFRWSLVLLAILPLAACLGRGPIDSALDTLEHAVKTVESRVGEYQGLVNDAAAKDKRRELAAQLQKDGAALQIAYTPVLNLELPKLSQDQERRRAELRQRAMVAAADLIDLEIPRSVKPVSP